MVCTAIRTFYTSVGTPFSKEAIRILYTSVGTPFSKEAIRTLYTSVGTPFSKEITRCKLYEAPTQVRSLDETIVRPPLRFTIEAPQLRAR
jgi:uncharacterized protein YneF (UPF0154 family)